MDFFFEFELMSLDVPNRLQKDFNKIFDDFETFFDKRELKCELKCS